jgi:asparagine synthase (glutamine-hydrolysing)
MCGIVGVIAFNDKGKQSLLLINPAVKALHKRGPDYSGSILFDNAALGHARLSVIDTSEGASQPFVSQDGRYTLVFNGEIYNYKSLKQKLVALGYAFKSESDTEVLLHWLTEKGANGIQDLDGFFSFCFYDKLTGYYLLARDRFGIKPLHIYQDDDKVIFASEMKAVFAFETVKKIDPLSLQLYLKFNYVPQPFGMLQNARKLAVGHYAIHDGESFREEKSYYEIPYKAGEYCDDSYEVAQEKVRNLLRESVENRMVADVPLGAFLSGGIDSSIITALASEMTPKLNTYSVGFKDEPLFDETSYAELVAKKYKTNHTVFSLANDDLLEELDSFLDYCCEPFADSSALAVNALCKKTRQDLTVALSGDGADELFSGYNKHMAEFMARQGGVKNKIIKSGAGLWNAMPKSRNSKLGNLTRQLDKYAKGVNLSTDERYWDWAGLMTDEQTDSLLKQPSELFKSQKTALMSDIASSTDFNDFLKKDMTWVLPGDMLTKVDLYSMANSLEVRVPFLDHNLVDYVFSLPSEYKIQKGKKKMLLQDAFRSYLPEELYHRPKHGFEVPLLKWFKGELWGVIDNKYLSKELIEDQGIFDYANVKLLKEALYSNNPNDAVANLWALIVFQHWWLRYLNN